MTRRAPHWTPQPDATQANQNNPGATTRQVGQWAPRPGTHWKAIASLGGTRTPVISIHRPVIHPGGQGGSRTRSSGRSPRPRASPGSQNSLVKRRPRAQQVAGQVHHLGPKDLTIWIKIYLTQILDLALVERTKECCPYQVGNKGTDEMRYQEELVACIL